MGLKYSNICTCGSKDEFSEAGKHLQVSKHLCVSSCSGEREFQPADDLLTTMTNGFIDFLSSTFGLHSKVPTQLCGSREYTAIYKLKTVKAKNLMKTSLVRAEYARPLICYGIVTLQSSTDEEVLETAAQLQVESSIMPLCVQVFDVRETPISTQDFVSRLHKLLLKKKKVSTHFRGFSNSAVRVIPFHKDYLDDAQAFNSMLGMMRGRPSSTSSAFQTNPTISRLSDEKLYFSPSERPIFAMTLHSGDSFPTDDVHRLVGFLEAHRLSWGSSHSIYEAEVRTLLCEGLLTGPAQEPITLSEALNDTLNSRVHRVQRAMYSEEVENDDHGGNSVFADAIARRSERFFEFSSFGSYGKSSLSSFQNRVTNGTISNDTVEQQHIHCSYISASKPKITRLDWDASFRGRYSPELSTADLRRSPSSGVAPAVFPALSTSFSSDFESLEEELPESGIHLDNGSTKTKATSHGGSLDSRLAVRLTKTPRLFVPASTRYGYSGEANLLAELSKVILNDFSSTTDSNDQNTRVEDSDNPLSSWAASMGRRFGHSKGFPVTQPISDCTGRLFGTYTNDPCFAGQSQDRSEMSTGMGRKHETKPETGAGAGGQPTKPKRKARYETLDSKLDEKEDQTSKVPFQLVSSEMFLKRIRGSIDVLSGDILTKTDPLTSLGHFARLAEAVGEHSLAVAIWAQIQQRTTWSLELAFSCLAQATSLKALSSPRDKHAMMLSKKLPPVLVHPSEWRDVLERAYNYLPSFPQTSYSLALEYLSSDQPAMASHWAEIANSAVSNASEYDFSQSASRFYHSVDLTESHLSTILAAVTSYKLGGPTNSLKTWGYASESLHALQLYLFRSAPVFTKNFEGVNHIGLPLYTGAKTSQVRIPVSEHFAVPLSIFPHFQKSQSWSTKKKEEKLKKFHQFLGSSIGKLSKSFEVVEFFGSPGSLSPESVLLLLESTPTGDKVSTTQDSYEQVLHEKYKNTLTAGLLNGDNIISAPRGLLQGRDLTTTLRNPKSAQQVNNSNLHQQLSLFEMYVLPSYIANSPLYQLVCYFHERSRFAVSSLLDRRFEDPMPFHTLLRWATMIKPTEDETSEEHSEDSPSNVKYTPVVKSIAPEFLQKLSTINANANANAEDNKTAEEEVEDEDQSFGLWTAPNGNVVNTFHNQTTTSLSFEAASFLLQSGIEVLTERSLVYTTKRLVSFGSTATTSQDSSAGILLQHPVIIQATPSVGYRIESSFTVRGLAERNIKGEHMAKLLQNTQMNDESFREATSAAYWKLFILTFVAFMTVYWVKYRLPRVLPNKSKQPVSQGSGSAANNGKSSAKSQ